MSDAPDSDDLDAIADALSRLRGRGRDGGSFGPGGPFGSGAHGAHGAHGPHHGPHGHRSRGRGVDADDAGIPFAGPGPFGRGFDGPPGRGGPARFRLLDALAKAPQPLTVGEIATAVGVDQPRASKLVQQAVGMGLVRREADPDDARRTRVALTDAGSQIARGMRGRRREQLAEALEDFTPDERAELVRLLAKLAEAWPGR